jgi:FAD/FMN-containing dehydrogenase
LASVSSLEEASAALQSAHAEGRRVRIGEDLTADSLTRILEHDPGDQTCTVEAGVRLSDLQTALAASGQRLSLDPPGDPTIGALLAENLSGPLRHRCGTPRDLVLGATLVLGDGTIASSGGKVVKNVAGYDLARLVCGSQGRLAFVARASFRLHPLPRASATVVVESDDPAGVVAALPAPSSSRARSTCSSPAVSPSCSKARGARSRRRWRRRGRSWAGPRRTRPSGTSRASARVAQRDVSRSPPATSRASWKP